MARKKNIKERKTQNEACMKILKEKHGHDIKVTTNTNHKKYSKKNSSRISKVKDEGSGKEMWNESAGESEHSLESFKNIDAINKHKLKLSKTNKNSSTCVKKPERKQQNDQQNSIKNVKRNSKGKKVHVQKQCTKIDIDEPPVKVLKQDICSSSNKLTAFGDPSLEIGESKYWIKTQSVISEEQVTGGREEKNEDDNSDSSSEWEEVEELPDVSNPEHEDVKNQLPDQPVEIIIQKPNLLKKRGRCGFDIQDWFRLQMNKFKRQTQINVHKVHLLCLLSAGIKLNLTCNDLMLQAHALSLVPGTIMENCATTEWNVDNLVKLVMWFHGEFVINMEHKEDVSKLEIKLVQKEVASVLELVLMFVIMCRALSLQVRLVHSLQPVTFKATDLKLKTEKKSSKLCEVRSSSNDDKATEGSKSLSSKLSSLAKKSSGKHKKANVSRRKQSQNKKTASSESSQNQSAMKSRHLPQRRCSSAVSYSEPTSEESDKDLIDLSTNQLDGQNDRKSTCNNEIDLAALSQSSDDDFEQYDIKFRSPSLTKRKRTRLRSISKNLSRDDSSSSSSSDRVIDYWSEVFLEKENRWICVDCAQAEVDHPENMELRASKPLCYVLGFDNSGIIKDITKRYASDYLSQMRKLRVDPDWWRDALKAYGPKTAAQMRKDDAEENQLEANLMTQPFPTSINEFKNHPLYALKRHLLKFEAIYPESAIPLGYIKNEPIYARECVHTLHSRENWLKEGRVVKIGQEPYKMVKSRKRPSAPETIRDKKELLTPLYGLWQTEEYIPPPAVDGKVPKNEYGNVEVFKPSMLPPGTVHLKLAGLNKIAKKLDIDCAPAMVGWEQHGSFAHPMMDGFIVCEEHKDILVAAWQEEEMIKLQKEAEKRQQRAESNWKRLVKGLLLREKMKVKFNLQEPEQVKTNSSSQPDKLVKKANDVALSWPRNRETQQSVVPKKEASVPFPFEMEQM